MSFAMVIYVSFDSKIVYTVNSCATIPRLPERIASHVGLSDFSNHMEVDWISSKLERLTNVVEINIFYSTN
jgi:hypothetical protein